MLTLTPGIAEELRQRSSRYSKVQGGVLVASVGRGSPADRSVELYQPSLSCVAMLAKGKDCALYIQASDTCVRCHSK